VLVEHVDVVGAQAAQAVVGNLENVLGTAVEPTRPGLAQIEAELGSDHDLIAERRNSTTE
jgi:hypothetical protein